ncbi:hypothetical protein FTUN_1391 [Frigoriglobus tundricola]|uniref:Uncharacterized protein n=1 Tax=Frigoriglobus tundricola TaxID=2774151 RepID=A0A6M5YIK1_9BACT|nr:hypothetical protein FTUN_1391 [Frigoriglobus tundricola]
MAYDAADTQITFTLADGTEGAISYNVPWDQVNLDQPSQTVTPTAFNLNIAGQDFAYQPGNTTYTESPTIQFNNGYFQGVNFGVAPVLPGFPLTSISMTNLTVTAVEVGSPNPMLVNADAKLPIKVTASTNATSKDTTIEFALAGKGKKLNKNMLVAGLTIDGVKVDLANAFKNSNGDFAGNIVMAKAGITGKHTVEITLNYADGTTVKEKVDVDFGK